MSRSKWIVLTVFFFVSATWAQMVIKNTSNQDLFQVDNTGQVTIGSSLQNGSLNVIGTAKVTQMSALTQPDKVLVTDTQGNLSTIIGSANGQILKWNGSVWNLSSDAVNDSDPDPNNEIQTLNQSGSSTISSLQISGGNSIILYESLLPNIRRDNEALSGGVTTPLDFDLGKSGVQSVNLNFAAHSGSGDLYVLKGNYTDQLAYGCASAGINTSTSAYFVPVYHQSGTTYRIYVRASGDLQGNFSITGVLY
ncbi:hypothetical protein GF407_07530 [candidate division KSB1 bacterium]|nr:hypothetical protein [candidate division KSB1 bacterium]